MLEADGEKGRFCKNRSCFEEPFGEKRLKWSVLQEVYSKEERQRKALEKKDTSVAQKDVCRIRNCCTKVDA